jgi:hypothetical protein
MLATLQERQLLGMKTSDEKQLASVLIDKRLAKASDVQEYIDTAHATGRKLVLFDVDAPLEVSLAGVLEREPINSAPGKVDPLPPFDIVASGFTSVRNDRAAVIALFEKPGNGTYHLYATRPDGARVEIATVSGGPPVIKDPQLFAEAVSAGPGQAEIIGQKRITREAIDEVVRELPPERAAQVRGTLRKYEGWTWKSALDAHSVEQPRAKASQ